MTVGLAATSYANKVLDHIHRAQASTAPAGNYLALHTGDPGAAGTSNAASVTTRAQVTFAAASGGSIASNNTPTWSNWAGTSPTTVTHFSNWDASTTGTFLNSFALTSSKTVQTGDSLTSASGAIVVSLAPIAA
ncbi:hypothetical protein GCM10010172_06700 [Paractinoplanes ferrugineus]|uniref:Uncharacterized protein n=1 Tax=Paractinoplanes ferrugineus TaxID=113564 RepID=A0A919JAH6_9ACTN|nr:hypothetical protein [Actinoplanes ferrugineus]GIE16302.1 hypothetical protein Afe05nite_81420 [Actinoplanes ferrugineus]